MKKLMRFDKYRIKTLKLNYAIIMKLKFDYLAKVHPLTDKL